MNIKKATHPNGDIITFREDEHSYIDNHGLKYTSVTTLIHDLFPPFDKVGIANKIASKRGKTPEQLISEWEEEANIACTFGTNNHFFAECYLQNRPLPSPMNEKEELYFNNIKRFIDEKLFSFKFIEAEKIIFSPKYGISGTIDLLMRNSHGQLCIFDWKTNKEIKRENKWQKGLTFLKHLDDCNYNHYSMQLNTYRKLLLEEEYFKEEQEIVMGLFFVKSEEVEYIPIWNMENEVDAVLSKCKGRI